MHIILILVAILTSVISAVAGMGGGILLLSIMTFFLTLDVIIPIHGVVQFTSNSSRVYFLRKHTLKKILIPYLIFSIIGVYFAVVFKKSILLDRHWILLIITTMIFYTLFKPKKLPHFHIPFWAFGIVGLINGFLGILIGSVGPFLAVFFLRDDLTKEEVIANKAFCQFFVHLLKIPAFISLGFNYSEYWLLWAPMIVSSIIGTKLGVGYLKKMDDQIFRKIYRAALLFAGIRLAYKIGKHFLV